MARVPVLAGDAGQELLDRAMRQAEAGNEEGTSPLDRARVITEQAGYLITRGEDLRDTPYGTRPTGHALRDTPYGTRPSRPASSADCPQAPVHLMLTANQAPYGGVDETEQPALRGLQAADGTSRRPAGLSGRRACRRRGPPGAGCRAPARAPACGPTARDRPV